MTNVSPTIKLNIRRAFLVLFDEVLLWVLELKVGLHIVAKQLHSYYTLESLNKSVISPRILNIAEFASWVDVSDDPHSIDYIGLFLNCFQFFLKPLELSSYITCFFHE